MTKPRRQEDRCSTRCPDGRRDLDRLTRRGALSDADVDAALREVRRALLEADVALEVVKAFVDEVRATPSASRSSRAVTPGQMIVKIVHDQLIETLGARSEPVDLDAPAPVPIMMVGLQGSGKTTTSAKLAKRLTEQLATACGFSHGNDVAGVQVFPGLVLDQDFQG